MDCREFLEEASAYIDGQLEANRRLPFAEHLLTCSYCRERVDQLQKVSGYLKSLSKPEAQEQMPMQILAAVDQQADTPWTPKEMFTLNIPPFRPRPAAHLVGFIVTVITFWSILVNFAPIIWQHWQPDFTVFLVDRRTIDNLNHNVADNEIYHGAGPYTLPRVKADTNLEQFTDEVNERTGGSGVLLLAWISSEGRPSLVNLLEPANDYKLRYDISAELQKTSFKPATRAGQPIPSNVVLLMHKITIQD